VDGCRAHGRRRYGKPVSQRPGGALLPELDGEGREPRGPGRGLASPHAEAGRPRDPGSRLRRQLIGAKPGRRSGRTPADLALEGQRTAMFVHRNPFRTGE